MLVYFGVVYNSYKIVNVIVLFKYIILYILWGIYIVFNLIYVHYQVYIKGDDYNLMTSGLVRF